jgi:predicted nucleic acid-binding protein
MKVTDSLQGVTRLFLDTAPVIYYIENHPQYFSVVERIFDRIDNSFLIAVTSPITLSECLVIPYRLGQPQIQQLFINQLVNGNNTQFRQIDSDIAQPAAELRSRYNLSLLDAYQVAIAIEDSCEAFLTNDIALKRVTELRVLVIDELDL